MRRRRASRKLNPRAGRRELPCAHHGLLHQILPDGVRQPLDAVGPLIVLVVGGWFVPQGSMPVGTLVVFISRIQKVAAPWDQLAGFYRTMSNARVKYRLIADTLPEGRYIHLGGLDLRHLSRHIEQMGRERSEILAELTHRTGWGMVRASRDSSLRSSNRLVCQAKPRHSRHGGSGSRDNKRAPTGRW
jgi:ABC-type multidrug transport system fused ATPase/permease subunit